MRKGGQALTVLSLDSWYLAPAFTRLPLRSLKYYGLKPLLTVVSHLEKGKVLTINSTVALSLGKSKFIFILNFAIYNTQFVWSTENDLQKQTIVSRTPLVGIKQRQRPWQVRNRMAVGEINSTISLRSNYMTFRLQNYKRIRLRSHW